VTSRIAVARLPVDTGRSGWEALCERRFPVSTLDGVHNADWIVVGAGFAGLTAARRLIQVRPGDKVVVLDAKEIADGPAGRNSGYMIDVPHNLSAGEYSAAGAEATAQEIAQNRFAIQYAAEAAAEYGMDRATFDPSGKINAAATERGMGFNVRYAASLNSIGEANTLLDAQAMRELTGSSYYLGGLKTPGAVMIQPAEYIRAFAAGVRPHVSLYENSPVTSLERQGSLWTARTPQGSVSAPKVILAVNGHIQSFGHFQGRLMHVFTYASMTAGFDTHVAGRPVAGAERWAVLPADPMGATVRKITDRQGKGRIVVRTRFTYDPSMEVSMARVQGIARDQQASFVARFPELAAVPMEASWAGRLCLSRNNVPAFGEIDEGLFSACCENGLGTVKSTLAGVLAVDLATGQSSPTLTLFMNQAAPSRIPPEPLAWLGINSVIRWQELRAGREA
jgi:glycine/D-amino acid oxidase-like deaminating enzyme